MNDQKPLRIAIAGFQHETNTFMPTRAGFHEFEISDSWPGMVFGNDVIASTRGINLPIAGAAEWAARHAHIEIIPILWCAAEPSGKVTDDAFDRITTHIAEALAAIPDLDGLYLDLHGAMVTESFDDGETEIIRRIRAVLPDTPIAVSLDLHANISAAFVDAVELITVFRTYPHLDMAETGARAISRLVDWIGGQHLVPSFQQVPFLIPLHAQFTGNGPCADLYDQLGDANDPNGYTEIALGFTAADIADCGPSVLSYAPKKNAADAQAKNTLQAICNLRDEFDRTLLTPASAVERAMHIEGEGPVVLADVQDNAGAGASSDTTGILHALANAHVPSALLGMICDADVAATAHARGDGNTLSATLGGKSGIPGDAPFHAEFNVMALRDGAIPYTGEMYGGSIAEIGPSCLLTYQTDNGAIWITVSSMRTQCLDRGLFTHFGVDPLDFQIVVVKSTVHYRADFEPGSRAILNVGAPGGFICDLEKLDYQNLRSEVAKK